MIPASGLFAGRLQEAAVILLSHGQQQLIAAASLGLTVPGNGWSQQGIWLSQQQNCLLSICCCLGFLPPGYLTAESLSLEVMKNCLDVVQGNLL